MAETLIIEIANLEFSEAKTIGGEKNRHNKDGFETSKWPFLLALPFMYLLTVWVYGKKTVRSFFGLSKPMVNSLWFDGLGQWCRKVKEGAASWRALEIIYNHPYDSRYGIGGKIDDFWWSIQNCQAIRNRFKLVKQEIKRAILKFDDQEEVRLVSLACGSAQAVLEVMADFKAKGRKIRSVLVDKNPEALDYARKLAEKYGLSDQVEIVETTVSRVARISETFRPHIVEMLGFLDYLPQEKAIKLSRIIRGCLEPRGVFLTCNIAPNPEMAFVFCVIDWPMVYRKPEEMAEIAKESGYADFRLVYEPLKIHGLLIAQK